MLITEVKNELEVLRRKKERVKKLNFISVRSFLALGTFAFLLSVFVGTDENRLDLSLWVAIVGSLVFGLLGFTGKMYSRIVLSRVSPRIRELESFLFNWRQANVTPRKFLDNLPTVLQRVNLWVEPEKPRGPLAEFVADSSCLQLLQDVVEMLNAKGLPLGHPMTVEELESATAGNCQFIPEIVAEKLVTATDDGGQLRIGDRAFEILEDILQEEEMGEFVKKLARSAVESTALTDVTAH